MYWVLWVVPEHHCSLIASDLKIPHLKAWALVLLICWFRGSSRRQLSLAFSHPCFVSFSSLSSRPEKLEVQSPTMNHKYWNFFSSTIYKSYTAHILIFSAFKYEARSLENSLTYPAWKHNPVPEESCTRPIWGEKATQSSQKEYEQTGTAEFPWVITMRSCFHCVYLHFCMTGYYLWLLSNVPWALGL